MLSNDYLEKLATEQTDQVCLTIKNYTLLGGLSRQFHDSHLNKQAFEIKGPMGKGLGLSSETKGLHMIFAAGTGILVFVDLIARLLLSNIGILPNDQHFHKDF